MGKIFGITSYIILIIVITFIVVGYARANQTVTFLEEQKTRIYDVPKDLITATLTANTQGQFDIYIKEDPILDVQVTHLNYHYHLMIFSVLMYESANNYNYDLVVLINDYENTDPFAFYNNEALTLMIDIIFESNPEGFTQNAFKEPLVQLYDDSMHMYAINQRYFIQSENQTRIERIEILYPTALTDISTLSLIHTKVYEEKGLIVPEDFEGDLKSLQPSTLQLEKIEDKIDWYINNTINQDFEVFNYFRYLYVGIEMFIFIPITYFVFFHKNIKRLKRNKEKQ